MFFGSGGDLLGKVDATTGMCKFAELSVDSDVAFPEYPCLIFFPLGVC